MNGYVIKEEYSEFRKLWNFYTCVGERGGAKSKRKQNWEFKRYINRSEIRTRHLVSSILSFYIKSADRSILQKPTTRFLSISWSTRTVEKSKDYRQFTRQFTCQWTNNLFLHTRNINRTTTTEKKNRKHLPSFNRLQDTSNNPIS